MIIKEYLQIILKRWWLVLLPLLAVVGGAYYWTSRQIPIYESHASFVIRPRSDTSGTGDFIKALDTVSNRSEINSTFAEVASSKMIKNLAIERLQLPTERRKYLDVSTNVIAGTNLMEVRVESPDPATARDFTNAVGAETVAYVKNLYDIYQLEPLDPANLPSKPVRPNPALNLGLGAFLGLALGVAMVFVMEMFKPSPKEVDTFNIIDRETGAYNKSYLMHRLFQEMARSKHTRAPLSVGLVKVDFDGDGFTDAQREEALRTVRLLTAKTIREEDILARFNGVVFAIVFPDLRSDRAQEILDNVRQAIDSVSHDMSDGTTQIYSHSSVVSYQGGKTNHDQLLERAFEGLDQVSPE
jgi:diguanylate cyclase (GGDEF)-like protein